MKKMPQVRAFMTPVPQTVDRKTPLTQVSELMRKMQIRHIPVKGENGIEGFVSEKMVREALADRFGSVLTAEEIMIREPYVVAPETELDEIVAVMAEEKYGCALVEDREGKLLGIFTTVDACRALRQILEDHYPTA